VNKEWRDKVIGAFVVKDKEGRREVNKNLRRCLCWFDEEGIEVSVGGKGGGGGRGEEGGDGGKGQQQHQTGVTTRSSVLLHRSAANTILPRHFVPLFRSLLTPPDSFRFHASWKVPSLQDHESSNNVAG